MMVRMEAERLVPDLPGSSNPGFGVSRGGGGSMSLLCSGSTSSRGYHTLDTFLSSSADDASSLDEEEEDGSSSSSSSSSSSAAAAAAESLFSADARTEQVFFGNFFPMSNGLRCSFLRRCPSAPSELSTADQQRLLQQQRLHVHLLQLERKVSMQERLLCEVQKTGELPLLLLQQQQQQLQQQQQQQQHHHHHEHQQQQLAPCEGMNAPSEKLSPAVLPFPQFGHRKRQDVEGEKVHDVEDNIYNRNTTVPSSHHTSLLNERRCLSLADLPSLTLPTHQRNISITGPKQEMNYTITQQQQQQQQPQQQQQKNSRSSSTIPTRMKANSVISDGTPSTTTAAGTITHNSPASDKRLSAADDEVEEDTNLRGIGSAVTPIGLHINCCSSGEVSEQEEKEERKKTGRKNFIVAASIQDEETTTTMRSSSSCVSPAPLISGKTVEEREEKEGEDNNKGDGKGEGESVDGDILKTRMCENIYSAEQQSKGPDKDAGSGSGDVCQRNKLLLHGKETVDHRPRADILSVVKTEGEGGGAVVAAAEDEGKEKEAMRGGEDGSNNNLRVQKQKAGGIEEYYNGGADVGGRNGGVAAATTTGGGGGGRKLEGMRPPPDQFFRIKLCAKYLRRACRKGSRCSYAHTEEELREIPNLRKTKLCATHKMGKPCPLETACPFAHGEEELRCTAEYYKTKLCKFWARERRCEAGEGCRHAHGAAELRPRMRHYYAQFAKGGSSRDGVRERCQQMISETTSGMGMHSKDVMSSSVYTPTAAATTTCPLVLPSSSPHAPLASEKRTGTITSTTAGEAAAGGSGSEVVTREGKAEEEEEERVYGGGRSDSKYCRRPSKSRGQGDEWPMRTRESPSSPRNNDGEASTRGLSGWKDAAEQGQGSSHSSNSTCDHSSNHSKAHKRGKGGGRGGGGGEGGGERFHGSNKGGMGGDQGSTRVGGGGHMRRGGGGKGCGWMIRPCENTVLLHQLPTYTGERTASAAGTTTTTTRMFPRPGGVGSPRRGSGGRDSQRRLGYGTLHQQNHLGGDSSMEGTQRRDSHLQSAIGQRRSSNITHGSRTGTKQHASQSYYGARDKNRQGHSCAGFATTDEQQQQAEATRHLPQRQQHMQHQIPQQTHMHHHHHHQKLPTHVNAGSSALNMTNANTSALYGLTAVINPYGALAACQQQASYGLSLLSAGPPSCGNMQTAAAAAAAVAAIAQQQQQQQQQLEAAAKAVGSPIYQNMPFLGPPFAAPFPPPHMPFAAPAHALPAFAAGGSAAARSCAAAYAASYGTYPYATPGAPSLLGEADGAGAAACVSSCYPPPPRVVSAPCSAYPYDTGPPDVYMPPTQGEIIQSDSIERDACEAGQAAGRYLRPVSHRLMTAAAAADFPLHATNFAGRVSPLYPARRGQEGGNPSSYSEDCGTYSG